MKFLSSFVLVIACQQICALDLGLSVDGPEKVAQNVHMIFA